MSDFNYLIQRYLSNTATDEERFQLMKLIEPGANEEFIKNGIAEMLREEMMKASPGLQDEKIITGEVQHRAQQIFDRIIATDKEQGRVVPMQTRSRKLWWAAAAALVGILFLAGYWLTLQEPGPSFQAIHTESGMLHKVNVESEPLKIALDDKSFVTLEPGAALTYPQKFSTEKREVFLTGEAFFNVTKDPNRPFYVFSDKLITRVVGTSFVVKSGANNGSEVAVMTGKVIVTQNTNKSFLQRVLDDDTEVTLLPNQKVVYETGTEELVVSLVENPRVLENNTNKTSFAFSAASLTNVIAMLGEAYGIRIVPQGNAIDHCTFTGDLTGEGLYTQLELICQSIGARYEVKETQILIKGGGCNEP